jgi:hypothetical protein
MADSASRLLESVLLRFSNIQQTFRGFSILRIDGYGTPRN